MQVQVRYCYTLRNYSLDHTYKASHYISHRIRGWYILYPPRMDVVLKHICVLIDMQLLIRTTVQALMLAGVFDM